MILLFHKYIQLLLYESIIHRFSLCPTFKLLSLPISDLSKTLAIDFLYLNCNVTFHKKMITLSPLLFSV